MSVFPEGFQRILDISKSIMRQRYGLGFCYWVLKLELSQIYQRQFQQHVLRLDFYIPDLNALENKGFHAFIAINILFF